MMYEVVVESRRFESGVNAEREELWSDLIECETYDMTSEMLVVKKGTYCRIMAGENSGTAVRPFEIIAYPFGGVSRIEIRTIGE